MTKIEMDDLRSTVLYRDERLKVIYNGKSACIPQGIKIEAYSQFKKYTMLPYPEPKWIACGYYIIDVDGDRCPIANTRTDRHGKLEEGFEWVNG